MPPSLFNPEPAATALPGWLCSRQRSELAERPRRGHRARLTRSQRRRLSLRGYPVGGRANWRSDHAAATVLVNPEPAATAFIARVPSRRQSELAERPRRGHRARYPGASGDGVRGTSLRGRRRRWLRVKRRSFILSPAGRPLDPSSRPCELGRLRRSRRWKRRSRKRRSATTGESPPAARKSATRRWEPRCR